MIDTQSPVDQVEERLLRISLIRVSVGAEDSTARTLVRQMPNSLVCKAFGEFDFVIVDEVQVPEEGLGPTLTADIVDIQVTTAYRWSGISPTLGVLASYPLCLLTFCKVRRDYLRVARAKGEYRLARHLGSLLGEEEGTAGGPAGSLGWSEIVLLTGTTDFERGLERVYAVREVGFAQGEAEATLGPQHAGNARIPVFTSSLTVPGVRISRDGRPVASGTWGRVRPKLELSCVPGSERWVASEVRSFGSAAREFGTVDVAVSITDAHPVAEYVESLWRFRALAKGRVHWTTTSLELPMDSDSQGKRRDES